MCTFVQLIYAVSEDGTEGRIGLIFSSPTLFMGNQLDDLRRMGVEIPSNVYVTI